MAPPINTADLFSVKGMVALITGGGTGIGLMMARALVDAGALRVYIVGRRQEVLEDAARAINRTDEVVVPLAGDVTSLSSLNELVSQIESQSGFLNLLVCNSGISGPKVPAPQTGKTTLHEWRAANLAVSMEEHNDTFNVNATAAWYTAIAFLELLDKGNKQENLGWSSQVIVTSSIGAFNRQAPGGYPYGQSKAAATHMTKQLATVLPVWGIRVNTLAPGLFPSDMSAATVQAVGGEAWSDVISVPSAMVPLGRMGDRLDMAGSILYLASRAGAYCNGNIMVVDGGRLGVFPSTY